MVGAVGVVGLPELPRIPASDARKQGASSESPPSEDSITLSSQAESMVAYAAAMNSADNVVRKERIAQARQNVENGVHRINDVLRLVAGRMSSYISLPGEK